MKKLFTKIFEDEYFVVVNKASGTPVIPGRTSEMDRSLKYLLKKEYGEIFIVHRIDQDTSGLVILAKSADAHRSMNTMFQNRKIEKKYLAITRGIPPSNNRKINFPLKKLNNQNKSVVHKEGKEALSSYEIIEKFGNYALCEAQIFSGRHHQLRVHFKAINSPLLVDPIYGDEAFFLSEIKSKNFNRSKDEIERPLLRRLSLHAWKLKFTHPFTDEIVMLEAEIPKDLKACLNQMRKLVK